MIPLTLDRAREIVDLFGSKSVLVVGDVMVDRFLFGRVSRISPEAPVPIVEFDHDEYRIGGAANVAHNVRALGGRTTLIGVSGADDASERLFAELRSVDVDPSDVLQDRERTTTEKLRIVTTRNQQVARVDFETDAALSPSSERALAARIEKAAVAADIIVVSDYLKGVITHDVMSQILACGRARGVAVLVDPKVPHLASYAGCSLITPNHQEAETAAHMQIRTNEDARAAARVLQARVLCDSVLITRGEHGMWLLEGSLLHAGRAEPVTVRERQLPAAAREVSDVTGAGDTVIATVALGLATGASLVEAAQLANHAAGIVVSRFGPATVTASELLPTFDPARA